MWLPTGGVAMILGVSIHDASTTTQWFLKCVLFCVKLGLLCERCSRFTLKGKGHAKVIRSIKLFFISRVLLAVF